MSAAPCRSCVSLYASYPYANAITAAQRMPHLMDCSIRFAMTQAVKGDTDDHEITPPDRANPPLSICRSAGRTHIIVRCTLARCLNGLRCKR